MADDAEASPSPEPLVPGTNKKEWEWEPTWRHLFPVAWPPLSFTRMMELRRIIEAEDLVAKMRAHKKEERDEEGHGLIESAVDGFSKLIVKEGSKNKRAVYYLLDHVWPSVTFRALLWAVFKYVIPALLTICAVCCCGWVVNGGLCNSDMTRTSEPAAADEFTKSTHGNGVDTLLGGKAAHRFHQYNALLGGTAAIFPVILIVMALLMDNLFLWTKVMICHSLLALFKGLSVGLPMLQGSKQACDAMRSERVAAGGIDLSAVGDMTLSDILGWIQNPFGGALDLSGHCYISILYGVAVYELFYLFTKEWDNVWRFLALGCAALLPMLHVLMEIMYAPNPDIGTAVVVTFLVFTNNVVALASKGWVYFRFKKETNWNDRLITDVVRRRVNLEEKYQANFSAKDLQMAPDLEKGDKELQEKQLNDPNLEPHGRGIVMMNLKELRSDGDVFLPPCLTLPTFLCCNCSFSNFTGFRHHFYDDRDLGDMMFTCSRMEQELMAQHTGVSMKHDIINGKNSMKLNPDIRERVHVLHKEQKAFAQKDWRVLLDLKELECRLGESSEYGKTNLDALTKSMNHSYGKKALDFVRNKWT